MAKVNTYVCNADKNNQRTYLRIFPRNAYECIFIMELEDKCLKIVLDLEDMEELILDVSKLIDKMKNLENELH